MVQVSDEMRKGMWVTILGAILIPLSILIFTIPALLLDALVVTKLWNWFVMEPFHTIKMHYALGLGLSLLTGFMTRSLIYKPKERADKDWAVILGFLFVAPLVILLTGYIVHHWM